MFWPDMIALSGIKMVLLLTVYLLLNTIDGISKVTCFLSKSNFNLFKCVNTSLLINCIYQTFFCNTSNIIYSMFKNIYQKMAEVKTLRPKSASSHSSFHNPTHITASEMSI